MSIYSSVRFVLLGSLLLGCTSLDPEGAADPASASEAEATQALTGYQVVSAETAVNTATSKNQSVSCPAGAKALGAGWAALDSTNAIYNDFIATYFEPSFDGASWTVRAKLAFGGAPSWKLRLSVLCSATTALTGYEVHAAETAVSTATALHLDHACPAGKRAVGAGWSVLDSTSAILEGAASYFEPSFDGASWGVRAKKLSTFTASWKLRSRVVCVNQTALPGYEVVLSETAANTVAVKQLGTACPAGKTATGAGWADLDSTAAILDGSGHYSMPSYNGASWLTTVRNNSGFSPTWKLRVRAICTL